MATPTSKIKKKILKQRGVVFEKHTRKPITHDDLPSPYHKTQLMKYVELKFSDRLENIISDGTIYEVGKRLGINYSTVSKWRKLIIEAKEREFWKQFD